MLDIVATTGKNLKKNVKKEKEILNLADSDTPCLCGHPRKSHLGDKGELCFGCYVEDTRSKKYHHNFKMDNLMYIEKLYKRKQLEKFKNES